MTKKRRNKKKSDNLSTKILYKKHHLFLKENCGKKLQKAGYNLFFNFTINSESPQLEPHVPPLDVRLDQLKQLCDQFGSREVNWRFDPICFFKTREGIVQDNLSDLDLITEKAAELGIKRCITSFMDPYPKIQKRLAALPGFSFSDPQLKTKKEIILKKSIINFNDTLIEAFCLIGNIEDELIIGLWANVTNNIPSQIIIAGNLYKIINRI